MTQQFHFWTYAQRKRKQDIKEVSTPPCSLQLYSREPRCENSVSNARWMDEGDVVCACVFIFIFSGILLSCEKVRDPSVCNMCMVAQ